MQYRGKPSQQYHDVYDVRTCLFVSIFVSLHEVEYCIAPNFRGAQFSLIMYFETNRGNNFRGSGKSC